MNILQFFKNLIFGSKTDNWQDGCLPSPQDYRDVPLGAVQEFVKLPENYRIPYILRISNQGLKPHCVGYSSATLKEAKERREQNFIDFDGDWIYNRCKERDEIPNHKGTYLRTGLKVLQKLGAKPLNSPEYEKYRIGGYIRADSTFEGLKQAIYRSGVVMAGFRGSNQGWKTAYIRPPKKNEKQWGHAVSLIGWNKKYIIGQNSWGEKKQDKGYFYFNENYLPFEVWAILVDLPNNWQELLGKEKEMPKYFFANNLWYGIKNEEVRMLQKCLKYKGCFPLNTECTGYFGLITFKAVKTFQIRYGIKPGSGYVGILTRAKLNDFFS